MTWSELSDALDAIRQQTDTAPLVVETARAFAAKMYQDGWRAGRVSVSVSDCNTIHFEWVQKADADYAEVEFAPAADSEDTAVSTDTELRAGGFEVVERPAAGLARWRRRGTRQTLDEIEALRIVRREEPYRDLVAAAKEDQAKKKRGV